MRHEQNKWGTYGTISEIAFFAFLYYIQILLRVEGNLLFSTLVLWGLINISIIWCPLLRKCYK